MKAAFIGIDYINHITNPKYSSATSAAMVEKLNVIENANMCMKLCADAGFPVILVRLGFSDSYVEVPDNSPVFTKAKSQQLFRLHSEGCDFNPLLQVQLANTTIVKPRISAFYGTALQPILTAQNTDTIIVGGVSTALTVQSTVRQAADMDFTIYVVSDACAAVSIEEHESSLAILSKIANVISVEQLGSLLTK